MSTDRDQVAPGYQRDGEPLAASLPCIDPGGRRWLLKPVPDDCRHDGGLHPAIADRLARVRDLPHPRVATLLGVVRGTDPAAAHLVWAWVDGVTLDRHAPSPQTFPALARSLASAVELLHARGLVHGALTPSNVIVTPVGDVWLTHLSPYLWADPADDVRAVADLLRPMAAALSLAALDDPTSSSSLRELAERWSTTTPPPRPPARRLHLGHLAIALAVLAASVAVAAVLHGSLAAHR